MLILFYANAETKSDVILFVDVDLLSDSCICAKKGLFFLSLAWPVESPHL